MNRPTPRNRSYALLLCCATGLGGAAVAQCTTEALAGQGLPGTAGHVYASTNWDPDGAGPLQPQLVLAGGFTLAGNRLCNFVGAQDPSSGDWSTFAGGMNDDVRALLVTASGELIAGGEFTTADGSPANRVARWNGTTWLPLGSGCDGDVNALAELPNGDIVAGGEFLTAGGAAVNNIARWDGSSWQPMQTGVAWPNPPSGRRAAIEALATLPNGSLVAGGWFLEAGGSPIIGIAQWNGSAWTSLGGNASSGVLALHVLPNGDLAAGGDFGTMAGVSAAGIARWDGGQWHAYGSGIYNFNPGGVRALTSTSNGDIVAAGSFNMAGGIPVKSVARWNGTSWSAVGPGIAGRIDSASVIAGDDIVCGGDFRDGGAIYVARWGGTQWSPLESGFDGRIFAVAARADGTIVAGGEFAAAGGQQAASVASFDGTQWSPLGSNLPGVVRGLAESTDGELFAGGSSWTSLGSSIARWNGTTWVPLPGGLSGSVHAIHALPNGDLIVAGRLQSNVFTGSRLVQRWDGTTYSDLGGQQFATGNGLVTDITEGTSGDVFVGGSFGIPGTAGVQHIARFHGTTLSPLGGGVDDWVRDLSTLPNGDVVAVGAFQNAGGISANCVARWDGTTWHAMGSWPSGLVANQINTLEVLPNGHVIVNGYFNTTSGEFLWLVMSWDGTTWSLNHEVGRVSDMCLSRAGELVLGGSFWTIDNKMSASFARITSTCAPSSTDLGGACTGSAGTAHLAVDSTPWLGATYRARGTNLPALSLGLFVIGFAQTSVPIANVIPEGQPGCNLLVTPDIVSFELAVGGAAAAELAIPNATSLIGATFFQQLTPIELDANLSLIAVTASNALELTIGSW